MSQRGSFFYAICILGSLIFAYQLLAGIGIIRFGSLERDFGWNPGRDTWGVYIREVDPGGAAAGKLEVGDRLIAINGDTRVQRGPLFAGTIWMYGGTRVERGPTSSGTIWLKMTTVPLKGYYTIRVSRGSSLIDVSLQSRLGRIPGRQILLFALLAVGVTWLLCGLLIGYIRPHQRITQLLSLASIGVGAGLAGFSIYPVSGFLPPGQLLLRNLSFGTLIVGNAAGFDFYLRFPPGVNQSKFWARLRYIFYPVALLMFAFLCLLGYLNFDTEAGMQVFYEDYHWINLFWQIFVLGVVLIQAAILGVLIRNYRAARESDQRRRVKWVFFGAIAGTAPPAILFSVLFLSPAVFGINLFSLEAARNTFLVSVSFFVFVPASLTYSVLKHQVMEIHVVIRRGVQYLLARNVLQAILLLPVAGIVWNILVNPNRTLRDIVFNNSVYFYGLVATSFGLIIRGRLLKWIDRKFFRESYNREQLLLELMEEVKKLDSLAEISGLVGKELELALHPKAIYFFFREGEKAGFIPGYSSGDTSQGLRIEEGSAIVQILEKQGSAMSLPLSEEEFSIAESERLIKQGITLMVPMITTDHDLSGVILLGEKRSEEPYTPEDCKLLYALAAQIAVLQETASLKTRIGKEQQVKRDVLAKIDEQGMNLLQECPVCHRCFDRSVQVCSNDGSKLELSLPVERTIEGKYRLDRLIGKGGAGAVYEAKDLRLDRKVAVKVMLGPMFGDPTALRRFEREARVSARLNHPNIIAVHDYGLIGSGGAFLVMELVQGKSLRIHMIPGAGLDPPIVADWFSQLFEGIETAHGEGVIHRDLKPENVLVMEKEKLGTRIKILDFGFAKLKLPDISQIESLTLPGTVLGTLYYMSPEQLSGQDVDERTDIFALGVMIAETLTGKRPFEGKTATELVISILHKEYHLEGASREAKLLDELLQRCLAKNRADRFSSVLEMHRALIPAIRDFSPPV